VSDVSPLTVTFRDPPPSVADERSKERRLAKALFDAREVPVFLPLFELFLNRVTAAENGFTLALGVERDASVVLVRLSRAADPQKLEVAVEPLTPLAKRDAQALAAFVDRLRRGLTHARWTAATIEARKVPMLASGVPLEALRQVIEGVVPPAGLLRTGFRCNQDCGMCWQSREWPDFGGAPVRTWIEDFARGGVRALTISGGEPMLDPELPSYVEHARALGFTSIQLETNAIQAAKPGHAARLAAAGVTEALVSLHSPDADVSDAITRAKGTHGRTLEGAQALLDAGIRVRINAVMTAQALATLPRLPDFLRARFGTNPRLIGLALSYPARPFEAALEATLVPAPEAVRAALKPTVDRAAALGLDLGGLSGPCGVPLCAIDADPRIFQLGREAPPVAFRTFLAACDGCAVRTSCYGVRVEEAAQFGERCVKPLARAPTT
jgi:hypothetical protein